MSGDYITISSLNDFVFCPYSIYLHNVYMESDEETYKATPQIKGTIAHEAVDTKSYSSRKNEILALPIISERLGLVGKIDVFKVNEKRLIERKYQLKQIFRGQLYQLWAQYICMREMGYEVEKICFYEISTNKTIPVELPSDQDMLELAEFIEKFRRYDPMDEIQTNSNKCVHCIYSLYIIDFQIFNRCPKSRWGDFVSFCSLKYC